MKNALCILMTLFTFSLSAEVFELTQKNYRDVVQQSDKPVVIDLYASWCPACRKMEPVFEKASVRYPGIRFAKVDIDQEPELSNRFRVSRLPTLVFLLPNKNEPVFRSIGMLSDEALDEKLKQLLQASQ